MANSAAIAVHPKCRFCSRHSPAKEFIGGIVVGMCSACYHWHCAALEVLAQRGTPQHCDGCHTPIPSSGDVLVALHRKDGVYQFLCMACDASYSRKRKDQFGGTPAWGHIDSDA